MILIAYDIANKKRLAKISKLLLNYGIRVQNSTFEFDINKKELSTLTKEIKKLLDTRRDKLFIYTISQKQENKIEVVGDNSWEFVL